MTRNNFNKVFKDLETISTNLTDIANHVCGMNCRWPAEFSDSNELYDEHCFKCPIYYEED